MNLLIHPIPNDQECMNETCWEYNLIFSVAYYCMSVLLFLQCPKHAQPLVHDICPDQECMEGNVLRAQTHCQCSLLFHALWCITRPYLAGHGCTRGGKGRSQNGYLPCYCMGSNATLKLGWLFIITTKHLIHFFSTKSAQVNCTQIVSLSHALLHHFLKKCSACAFLLRDNYIYLFITLIITYRSWGMSENTNYLVHMTLTLEKMLVEVWS